MKYLFILIFSVLFVCACSKDRKDSEQPKNESASEQNEVKKNTDVKDDKLVFLGRFTNGKLLIEDNRTYEKNALSWAKDTMENYFKYTDYLKSIAKKYASFKEEIQEYNFEKDFDEFNKLTTLKKGTKLYISTQSSVTPVEITGFYMNFDDLIGSGIVFYAVADAGKLKLADNEVVICTGNEKMSVFNTAKLNKKDNSDLFNSVTSLMMKKAKDVKVKDEVTGQDRYEKVTGIDTSEIVIFPGSFTSAGAKEYIAGYTKRQSFDNFAYYIIIVNEKGELVKVFSELVKDSFTYETITGIVDINGDGIHEVLTEDGYYEGAGYNLHKFDGMGFNVITSGFFFGV